MGVWQTYTPEDNYVDEQIAKEAARKAAEAKRKAEEERLAQEKTNALNMQMKKRVGNTPATSASTKHHQPPPLKPTSNKLETHIDAAYRQQVQPKPKELSAMERAANSLELARQQSEAMQPNVQNAMYGQVEAVSDKFKQSQEFVRNSSLKYGKNLNFKEYFNLVKYGVATYVFNKEKNAIDIVPLDKDDGVPYALPIGYIDMDGKYRPYKYTKADMMPANETSGLDASRQAYKQPIQTQVPITEDEYFVKARTTARSEAKAPMDMPGDIMGLNKPLTQNYALGKQPSGMESFAEGLVSGINAPQRIGEIIGGTTSTENELSKAANPDAYGYGRTAGDITLALGSAIATGGVATAAGATAALSVPLSGGVAAIFSNLDNYKMVSNNTMSPTTAAGITLFDAVANSYGFNFANKMRTTTANFLRKSEKAYTSKVMAAFNEIIAGKAPSAIGAAPGKFSSGIANFMEQNADAVVNLGQNLIGSTGAAVANAGLRNIDRADSPEQLQFTGAENAQQIMTEVATSVAFGTVMDMVTHGLSKTMANIAAKQTTPTGGEPGSAVPTMLETINEFRGQDAPDIDPSTPDGLVELLTDAVTFAKEYDMPPQAVVTELMGDLLGNAKTRLSVDEIATIHAGTKILEDAMAVKPKQAEAQVQTVSEQTTPETITPEGVTPESVITPDGIAQQEIPVETAPVVDKMAPPTEEEVAWAKSETGGLQVATALTKKAAKKAALERWDIDVEQDAIGLVTAIRRTAQELGIADADIQAKLPEILSDAPMLDPVKASEIINRGLENNTPDTDPVIRIAKASLLRDLATKYSEAAGSTAGAGIGKINELFGVKKLDPFLNSTKGMSSEQIQSLFATKLATLTEDPAALTLSQQLMPQQAVPQTDPNAVPLENVGDIQPETDTPVPQEEGAIAGLPQQDMNEPIIEGETPILNEQPTPEDIAIAEQAQAEQAMAEQATKEIEQAEAVVEVDEAVRGLDEQIAEIQAEKIEKDLEQEALNSLEVILPPRKISKESRDPYKPDEQYTGGNRQKRALDDQSPTVVDRNTKQIKDVVRATRVDPAKRHYQDLKKQLTQAKSKASRIEKKLGQPDVDSEAYAARLSEIDEKIGDLKQKLVDARQEWKTEQNLEKKVTPSKRGTAALKAQLANNLRDGNITDLAEQMARWFIDRSPDLFEGVRMSVVRKTKGNERNHYKPWERIITILKGNHDEGTIVHELAHSTEHFIPSDMRADIVAEWQSGIYKELKKVIADPTKTKEANYLLSILDDYTSESSGGVGRERSAKEMDAFNELPNESMEPYYKYLTPSEWYAEHLQAIVTNTWMDNNGMKISKPENPKLIARIRQFWYSLMKGIQHLFTPREYANVVKAYNHIVKNGSTLAYNPLALVSGRDVAIAKANVADNNLRKSIDNLNPNAVQQPMSKASNANNFQTQLNSLQSPFYKAKETAVKKLEDKQKRATNSGKIEFGDVNFQRVASSSEAQRIRAEAPSPEVADQLVGDLWEGVDRIFGENGAFNDILGIGTSGMFGTGEGKGIDKVALIQSLQGKNTAFAMTELQLNKVFNVMEELSRHSKPLANLSPKYVQSQLSRAAAKAQTMSNYINDLHTMFHNNVPKEVQDAIWTVNDNVYRKLKYGEQEASGNPITRQVYEKEGRPDIASPQKIKDAIMDYLKEQPASRKKTYDPEKLYQQYEQFRDLMDEVTKLQARQKVETMTNMDFEYVLQNYKEALQTVKDFQDKKSKINTAYANVRRAYAKLYKSAEGREAKKIINQKLKGEQLKKNAQLLELDNFGVWQDKAIVQSMKWYNDFVSNSMKNMYVNEHGADIKKNVVDVLEPVHWDATKQEWASSVMTSKSGGGDNGGFVLRAETEDQANKMFNSFMGEQGGQLYEHPLSNGRLYQFKKYDTKGNAVYEADGVTPVMAIYRRKPRVIRQDYGVRRREIANKVIKAIASADAAENRVTIDMDVVKEAMDDMRTEMINARKDADIGNLTESNADEALGIDELKGFVEKTFKGKLDEGGLVQMSALNAQLLTRQLAYLMEVPSTGLRLKKTDLYHNVKWAGWREGQGTTTATKVPSNHIKDTVNDARTAYIYQKQRLALRQVISDQLLTMSEIGVNGHPYAKYLAEIMDRAERMPWQSGWNLSMPGGLTGDFNLGRVLSYVGGWMGAKNLMVSPKQYVSNRKMNLAMDAMVNALQNGDTFDFAKAQFMATVMQMPTDLLKVGSKLTERWKGRASENMREMAEKWELDMLNNPILREAYRLAREGSVMGETTAQNASEQGGASLISKALIFTTLAEKANRRATFLTSAMRYMKQHPPELNAKGEPNAQYYADLIAAADMDIKNVDGSFDSYHMGATLSYLNSSAFRPMMQYMKPLGNGLATYKLTWDTIFHNMAKQGMANKFSPGTMKAIKGLALYHGISLALGGVANELIVGDLANIVDAVGTWILNDEDVDDVLHENFGERVERRLREGFRNAGYGDETYNFVKKLYGGVLNMGGYTMTSDETLESAADAYSLQLATDLYKFLKEGSQKYKDDGFAKATVKALTDQFAPPPLLRAGNMIQSNLEGQVTYNFGKDYYNAVPTVASSLGYLAFGTPSEIRKEQESKFSKHNTLETQNQRETFVKQLFASTGVKVDGATAAGETKMAQQLADQAKDMRSRIREISEGYLPQYKVSEAAIEAYVLEHWDEAKTKLLDGSSAPTKKYSIKDVKEQMLKYNKDFWLAHSATQGIAEVLQQNGVTDVSIELQNTLPPIENEMSGYEYAIEKYNESLARDNKLEASGGGSRRRTRPTRKRPTR